MRILEKISKWWKEVVAEAGDGVVAVVEEDDHRLVDCERCPAKDKCEHQGADACCFGQWGTACNVPNACVDQEACREVTEGTAVVVVEETE